VVQKRISLVSLVSFFQDVVLLLHQTWVAGSYIFGLQDAVADNFEVVSAAKLVQSGGTFAQRCVRAAVEPPNHIGFRPVRSDQYRPLKDGLMSPLRVEQAEPRIVRKFHNLVKNKKRVISCHSFPPSVKDDIGRLIVGLLQNFGAGRRCSYIFLRI